MNYTIYSDNIEPEALQQFFKAMEQPNVVQGALMPDAHTGYTLPIGGVIAVKNAIYPSYIGYDIGCGMCAYRVSNIHPEEIRNKSDAIFNAIYHELPVGRNGFKKTRNTNKSLHKKIEDVCAIIGDVPSVHVKKIGTLGGGNHFAEIGYDENGEVWLIVHSGSRNFGHKIASYFMYAAMEKSLKRNHDKYYREFLENNKDFKFHNPEGFEIAAHRYIHNKIQNLLKGSKEGHYYLDADSDEGKSYISCMNVALEYALENRKDMINIILNCVYKIIGKEIVPVDYTNEQTFINRNHNHADFKNGLWIHRKGATHAEEGMMGVIPGNMRDGSFIVRGKGNPESLCSSSHGAGRVLGRRQAKRILQINDFEKEMNGIKAKVGKSTLDESPSAYKNIFEVMENQKDLVEVVHHVKPILNIKG